MATSQDQSDRARAMWLACLASASRTAFACIIVAVVTLYGPTSIRDQVAMPAFSYVNVILIVRPDATLGDTFRGFWLALYATIGSVGSAILSLWVIGPAQLTASTTALAVALTAFVVVLPGEATHLVSKRIALGQIVLVYVMDFIGASDDVIVHPVHVAASTAVGVFACVVALLVPFPRLACREVKQNSKLLMENASERLKLFVKAFCVEDNAFAHSSILQTKSLAYTATKLFQTIQRHQKSMQWERLPLTLFRRSNINPIKRLQALDVSLKGMEMALMSSTPSFPVGLGNGEMKNALAKIVEEQMSLNKSLPCEDATTFPKSKPEIDIASLQTLQTIPQTLKKLPSFFFLFCASLLHGDLPTSNSSTTSQDEIHQKTQVATSSDKQREKIWGNFPMKVNGKNVMAAFKLSLSLGLAVFLGLIFSKQDGHWSGLSVAISYATAREATFKVANFKAQGTVLGSVYGVFGCFLFHRFLPIKILSLLPWFIFTSFLQKSKMYGQAGGISAVIGAVIILGRTKFGTPSEFAIARITETFIGLSCSIFVELLFQPTRASTLAKDQLFMTLGALHECVNSVSLLSERAELEESQKRLKLYVEELGKLISEADVEPNFWFLPFQTSSYEKLMSKITTMMELLVFSSHAIGVLEENSQLQGSWKSIVTTMECDLEVFKKMVCFREIATIKSSRVLDERERLDDQESEKICDIELGKPQRLKEIRVCGLEDEDTEMIVGSYLLHAKEAVDKIHCEQNDEEIKGQIVLSLSALGFCVSGLMRATREIEDGIQELVQWEKSFKPS